MMSITRSVTDAPRGGRALDAMLVLVAATVLVWLVTHVGQTDFHPAETRITLGGAHFRAEPAELNWLESFSLRHFGAGEEQARAIVASEIDSQLDTLFAHAHERIPAFLDWYYSLRGEYSRIAMSALALVDLAEPDYVAERAASLLLPEEEWAAHLTALERQAGERLAAHQHALRATWLETVERQLAGHRVPAPIDDGAGRETLALDGLLGEIATREAAALNTRLSVSTVAAAGGAAAPALARAAAARTSRAAASRAAARGASRIGAAAASGAAVCAAGGPAAAACALLAGAGAWLVTDWTLLRVDEHRNRQELERAFGETLTQLRAQLDDDLTVAFDGLISAQFAAVDTEIRRSFVPASGRMQREPRE